MNEHMLKMFIVVTLSVIVARGSMYEFRRFKELRIRDMHFWLTVAASLCLILISLVVLFNMKHAMNEYATMLLIALPIVRYGGPCIRDIWNLFTQDVCHIAVHFFIGRVRVQVKGPDEGKKKFVFIWFTRPVPEFSRERIIYDVEFSLNEFVKFTLVAVASAYVYVK